MTDISLQLDHVGAAVRDLDAGAALYRSLGFTLTKRSVHSGAREPGGPVISWGSGNYCAMLSSGYLEIIGVTDHGKYSNVKLQLERYQGVHTVAFRCGDAQLAYKGLQERAAGVRAPSALQRDASFGESGSETRRAQFQNIYFDAEEFPEARFIVIHHLTPDVLWQPHLLKHSNGATALLGTQICVDDDLLERTAAKLAHTFNADVAKVATGAIRLQLKTGALHVLARSLVETRHALPAVPPCVVGFTIGVTSIGDLTKRLNASGYRSALSHDLNYVVSPAFALGTAITFVSLQNRNEAQYYVS
jgi:catechol 2,3-dioxygenase-like lactoylglutathione lyase family enzyme